MADIWEDITVHIVPYSYTSGLLYGIKLFPELNRMTETQESISLNI